MVILSHLNIIIISLFLLLACPVRAEFQLTDQERSWVAEHQKIPYAVISNWPLDYIEAGTHYGLSRAYLDEIEKLTSLRFRPVEDGETPAFIANVPADLLSFAQHEQWLLVQRWVTTNALIVTRYDTDTVRTLSHLRSRRVAVQEGSAYEQWLRRFYPEIKLLSLPDMTAQLQSVVAGEADAVIGSDLSIQPLLNRRYAHKLAVAGQLPELVTGLHMAVSPEWQPLHGILSRALASMPAQQSDRLFSEWIGSVKTGQLSAGMIMAFYPIEIGLFLFMVLCLFLALYHSMLQRRRAERSEQRKSEFLAMMSHEIRTPMNALVAALELLKLPVAPEQREEYISLALSSSRNLQGLLNDILDHCKLSQKQLKLEKRCFILSDLIYEVESIHQPLTMQKGLLLSATVASTLEGQWIMADEYRLRQVMNNLLGNAIKFTEQGYVTLDVTCYFSDKSEPWLCIQVSDTGIGIAPEIRHRLFEAWTQADSATTRRYDGSGLGLHICHELVELAGGTLECESEPDKGSVFSLHLPVAFCAAPAQAVPEQTLHKFREGTSILVVEDHPANQKMLAAQLATLNCQYELAGDGNTALTLIMEENYYDAILLDCNLPDIDGYEVARRIREIELENDREPTPIIAISALSGPDHHDKCQISGMDAMLGKPLPLQSLSCLLTRWCQTEDASEPAALQADAVLSEEELNMYINEDINEFHQALLRGDHRYMLHYIHRVSGAAQMYGLYALATKAKEIENALREGEIPSDTHASSWVDTLKSLTFSEAHL